MVDVFDVCIGFAGDGSGLGHCDAARAIPDIADRREPEQCSVFAGDAPGLLAALLASPFIPAVSGDDAAGDAVKSGFVKDGFGAGVDNRLHDRTSPCIHTAHRNDAPAHLLKAAGCGDQDILPRLDIVARRFIAGKGCDGWQGGICRENRGFEDQSAGHDVSLEMWR